MEVFSIRMILPDILVPNLDVVFCGTAAGAVSAKRGAYYAGPGNMFWKTLHLIGLTPHQLEPEDFPTVTQYRIGLTDIAKHTSGADSDLATSDFDADALRQKIEKVAPTTLAFNGKRSAQEYFGFKRLNYGLQASKIGTTAIFVLPSTSGAARKFWDIQQWFTLAAFLKPDPKP